MNDEQMKELLQDVSRETILREKQWQAKVKFNYFCIASAVFVLVVAMVCSTFLVCRIVTEQQYALNMQFADMADIVYGLQCEETGDNGIIINGDSNTTQGGTLNGTNY